MVGSSETTTFIVIRSFSYVLVSEECNFEQIWGPNYPKVNGIYDQALNCTTMTTLGPTSLNICQRRTCLTSGNAINFEYSDSQEILGVCSVLSCNQDQDGLVLHKRSLSVYIRV